MKIIAGIAGRGYGLVYPCRMTDKWEDQQKGKIKILQMHVNHFWEKGNYRTMGM